MDIDIATLFILVVMLCVVVGSIFLWASFRDRGDGLALRAGAGLFVIAVGLALVLARGTVPDWFSIVVANALITLGMGLLWSVARVFERRPAPPGAVVAGAAAWVAACAIPTFYADMSWRIALISFIAAAYSLAAGFEFWRGRGERLQARIPLATLCVAHAALVCGRGIAALAIPPTGGPLEGNWLQNLFMLEAPLALIGGAFLAVSLVRERAEGELRRSAETDDLTGILNRRAFLARSGDLIKEERKLARPVVLLLFDLDHFKTINDRYGHAAGDRTLRLFAATASQAIRATDVFGRIGGEEFAAFLPGCDAITAHRIAERIRGDFANRATGELGPQSSATVSVGVASNVGEAADLETLMAAADEALYQSKRGGRDRVSGSLAVVG